MMILYGRIDKQNNVSFWHTQPKLTKMKTLLILDLLIRL